MNSGGLDRLKIARYELKYIIPAALVPQIEDYIQIYCEKDAFSHKSDDGYYTVNSLYLDSHEKTLLTNKRENMSKRFSLRIRSYGDGKKAPYFFEVKKKAGMIVDKVRACTNETDLDKIINASRKEKYAVSEADQYNLDYFLRKKEALQAKPQILTQYRRLAYFSVFDEYARITFDKNLKFCNSKKYNVKPGDFDMKSYDYVDFMKGNAASSVILEIKTLVAVPTWITEFIQFFNLDRSSFSKFESSIVEASGARESDFFYLSSSL